MAALNEPTPARVLALQTAMHLTDIQATHNDKEVSAESVVESANTILNYLTAVPSG